MIPAISFIGYRPERGVRGGGHRHHREGHPQGRSALLSDGAPTLDEQRRIAEVLRSVDEAIAANEAALWQRDRIRKGFGSLFHCGLGHSEFQTSCIGEIPASWQVKTMKDVCHNVGVGIASSATHAYAEQGVPLLRNQNIKPGHLDLDDLLFVNEDYDRSYASKRVQTGDIITMRTGYPGRSAVIPPELAGCQTFTTLISRPKLAVVDPLFLCEWINSEPGMVEIRKRQAGGAQQNLNAGAMEQVPVPLPPMEEQRQIASILRNFPTEDDALIAELRKVRKLMQADLLSGRVRVPA
ncbi:MAG: restriction endonuclease subunit S [Caenibius sp.]